MEQQELKIPDQLFAMMMKRFDTVEAQNNKQLLLIEAHVKQDDETRAIVERHSTYFGFMSMALGAVVVNTVHTLFNVFSPKP